MATDKSLNLEELKQHIIEGLDRFKAKVLKIPLRKTSRPHRRAAVSDGRPLNPDEAKQFLAGDFDRFKTDIEKELDAPVYEV